MNTMKWLVKREYWEHKGGFFWAPVWVAGIMALFITATLITAAVFGSQHGFSRTVVNGTTVSTVTQLSSVMTPEQQTEAAAAIATGYVGLGSPLFVVLGFVVFFFCLGALYDERKDRSVLFWKSLPVSDSATVLSKVVIALVVAPVITYVVAVLMSLFLLIVLCITSMALGLHVAGQVMSMSSLYLAPLQVAAMLPVYLLWALPTVGWLMMVSAWARTKPFLWAVGVPLLTGGLLSWFNALFGFGWNIQWFWQHIVGRGLLSVFPGSWFAHHPFAYGSQIGMGMQAHSDDFGLLATQSWHVLATADAWIGVVAGIAMLFIAIRLRRWRDEG